jgi:ornithine cyclodeaminase
LEVQATTLREVVSQSVIISTAISIEKGKGPVFQDCEVKPWLHVNAVGSDFKGKYEILVSLLKRSIVVPDFLAQALVEGECQQLHHREIGATLTEIIQSLNKYPSLKENLTIFDSTGWAFEDLIAMEILIDQARKLELGIEIQIECYSSDPENPYESFNKPAANSMVGYGDKLFCQTSKN